LKHAHHTRHRKRRPGDVLQGLAGGSPALPLDRTPRRRQQQSRLDERQPPPPGQHQQSQHNQLPQRHGRRRPNHLHRSHRQGRPPQSIHHKIRRSSIQTANRGPNNLKATQGIPQGDKKSNNIIFINRYKF